MGEEYGKLSSALVDAYGSRVAQQTQLAELKRTSAKAEYFYNKYVGVTYIGPRQWSKIVAFVQGAVQKEGELFDSIVDRSSYNSKVVLFFVFLSLFYVKDFFFR
jgi:hypothetical protein